MQYIDTHAHLDLEHFQDDLDEVIARCVGRGVRWTVVPGISAESSVACLMVARSHKDSVVAAVGIQPNSCAEVREGDWDRIVQLCEDPQVVALGETGLDNYWDFAPIELQKEYFDRHLRLSQETGLPIIIHSREADDDLLPMLREARERGPIRGVIHAFSTTREVAAECVELGLHISFAGSVTYRNKKFAALWDAATVVPDDRLLAETDSPYMTPHPLRGKQKRNEPHLVSWVVERLAELRGADVAEIAEITTRNAADLFSLEL